MIISIWCEDINRGIGYRNKMPWYIKEELLHFQKTTINSTVIMGYNTFKSLDFKPLRNRINIIVTSKKNIIFENVRIINDVDYLISKYKNSNDIVYVIGGKKIFDIFIKESHYLYVSKLKKAYNCDLYMNNNFDNFYIDNIIKNKEFDLYIYKRKNKEVL